MRTEISREIEIDAPPDAVWAVLADTGAYPEWNPFVRRLSGELREGERLEAEIAPPGGRSTASIASSWSRSPTDAHASSSPSASADFSSDR
jgi:uncharacterized protein YndB with AHSA1/START domain